MDNPSREYLSSNGLKIPFTEEYFEHMKPSFIEEGSKLLTRYEEQGYLYLPSFFDAEKVLDIREHYFSMFDPIIFKEHTTPRQGIFSGTFQYSPQEHGHEHHPAAKFVTSPIFESFSSDRKIFDLADILLGKNARQLKRKPLRHYYNTTHRASRAHIDHTYLDEGTEKLITMWVPFGDVSLDGGGLVYLKGSHKMDHKFLREQTEDTRDLPTDTRPITHDLKKIAEIAHEPWLYTEFKAGDLLVHSPFIVHASLDVDSGAMRLSTDIRFCSDKEKPDVRWSGTWRGDDGY